VTLIFFLLAVWYSVATPIFEISDEFSHYPVVHYIAERGELPVQDTARTRPWDWEGAQPPLYYVLAAVLVAPLDRGDLSEHLIENPHTKTGIGLATDNHNVMLHDWEAQSFPWKGTPLAVHVVRLFSVLLGTGAVWMSFAVARLAVPEKPAIALAAQCLTAFNPMFLAIVGSVNNDNLVIFLATMTLAVILTVWRERFTWRRVWLLAMLCTLAAASKVSGTGLFLPAGLVILLVVWRDKKPLSYVAFSAGIFLLVWGGLFGWWYVRNLDLYGEPLATYHMAQTVGLRENPISILELIREEYFSFFAAYWGWFGTLSILAPDSLFDYAAVLWGLAVVGLGVYFASPPAPLSKGEGESVGTNGVASPLKYEKGRGGSMYRPDDGDVAGRIDTSAPAQVKRSNAIPFALLTLTLLVALVSFVQWTLTTNASQGRLLFPFVSIISTFTALGLTTLLGKRWGTLITAPLLMYALVSIGYTIPHAFRLPEAFDDLPIEANPVDVRYGDIELLGYRIDPEPVNPEGNTLKVWLYWRPLEKTNKPLSLYIQAFAPAPDEDGVIEVGKVDSYPGRGMLRSDSWETGIIYEDVYQLEIKNWDGRTPFEPRLKIGWRDNATGEEIPPTTASGESIPAVIVQGGRVSSGDQKFSSTTPAVFGDMIRLHQAEVSQAERQLRVDLVWEALRPISEDFTVFVQLIDPAQPTQPLAFGDSVPRGGWWRTSLWIAGERFADQYVVPLTEDIPAGEYEIVLGFYRPVDFTRLPVNVPPYPDAYGIPVRVD
jgi:hypothetical protein